MNDQKQQQMMNMNMSQQLPPVNQFVVNHPIMSNNNRGGYGMAKKAGGITSLVSPCPVTPAVLPTPIFSPSREVLVDMAKEEWGVDGYGSMKGLIRLRSNEGDMIYPNYGVDHSSYNLENRVDDQDTHIAQLEEENLILKERMFLMEREFDDLRMRLQRLERQSRGGERLNEEVVENDSENDSESRGYGRSIEDNNEVMEENNEQSEDNNDGVNAEIKQSDSMGKGIQETEAGTKVANNEVMEENNQQFEGNNGDDADVKQSDSVEKGLQAMEAGINVANNVEETKGLDVGTDVCMEETESVKENDDGAALVDKNAEVSVGGDGSAKDEEKV
ncbi:PRLI-interacting factor [Artemisia annua]|uniref:PRLI-interacting factor n=1 Tax=Artemisia annua TaxID=35608 RepID=A0A2U1PLX9_ARTAN|nr:PRLI-interacting factor [Artemisia annua]